MHCPWCISSRTGPAKAGLLGELGAFVKAARAAARSPSPTPARRDPVAPATRSPGCRRQPPGLGPPYTANGHWQDRCNSSSMPSVTRTSASSSALATARATVRASLHQRRASSCRSALMSTWAMAAVDPARIVVGGWAGTSSTAGHGRAAPPQNGRPGGGTARGAHGRGPPGLGRRSRSAASARPAARWALTGSTGRRRCPQQQLYPVGAGNGGRVGHPLPQLQRAGEVAERLGGGEDCRRLLGRPHRRGQAADEVMARQAVVGEFAAATSGSLARRRA